MDTKRGCQKSIGIQKDKVKNQLGYKKRVSKTNWDTKRGVFLYPKLAFFRPFCIPNRLGYKRKSTFLPKNHSKSL